MKQLLTSQPANGTEHTALIAAIQSNLDELSNDLSTATGRLTALEKHKPEDLRAKYADTAEWARHYSTVRMTVATFTLTTCVAIVALAPGKLAGDEAKPVLANAVCLLWLLGMAVFYVFTLETYKSCNRQFEAWRELTNETIKPKVLSDISSWVLLVLNTSALIYQHFGVPPLEIWGVLRILLATSVVTILFFMFLADKCIQPKEKKKRWPKVLLLISGPAVVGGAYVLHWLYVLCCKDA